MPERLEQLGQPVQLDPAAAAVAATDAPRSNPSSVMAVFQPLPTPPTTWSARAFASVKKNSQNSAWPVRVRIGRTRMPGWSIGSSSIEMPACLAAVGSVRARTKIQLAASPAVCQVFWPLTTHTSPTSSARVRSEARSDPASGSE